jgi:tetratricopeptide (TPR) repeat protein
MTASKDKNEQADLDRRLDLIAHRSSRRYFTLVLFLLLFSAVMGLMVYRQFGVLDSKLESLRVTSPPPTSASTPAAADAEKIEAIKSRLNTLEQLQEAMVSSSKNALEQMNFVFGIGAALVGVFGLYSLYKQTVAEAGRDRHEEEMRGLAGSFRENMAVINSLIVTLEASFKHRELVEGRMKDLSQQLDDIARFKSNIEQSLNERLVDLNSEAFDLFQQLDRENFKAEENRGRLENFYITMNALERTGEVKTHLSPFSYFMRALHFFNVTQYKPASEDLEAARRSSAREIAEPTIEWYRNSPANEVVEAVRRMEKDCCYHLGIIYYNLGEYGKARDRFGEAYQRDQSDLRSRAYIPELMFFEAREPFKRIILEFEQVEREFDRWQMKEGRERVNLEANFAALLMRKGNCYLPKAILLPKRSGFHADENADEALQTYEKAYEFARKTVDNSAKPPLIEVFVRFSLAQASKAARRLDSEEIQERFQRVFFDIRKQVALKTEPIVLTLFNYVLAICVHEGRVPNESAGFYLSRVREQLQRVPNDVRIFSPINKINLDREEFISEMEDFESEVT